jgi:superfamily II DNA or RNA helicase
MIEVELSGVKLIKNLTPEQKAQIKEELTFDNPQYESAKKHSRFGAGSIPPYIEYFTEGKGGLIVPRGYSIPFTNKIVKDSRVINHIQYPKLYIELRQTQKEAVEKFLHFYKEEMDERGVIILPTGKGKSILGLYLARKFSQRVLVVVQKDDLVDGWTKDAKVIFGLKPKEVGLIKAKDYRLGKQITITTVQTLSKLPPEKIKQLHDYFGMVIVDEFHHSVARIYNMINYFPARFKIGLTATAMRNDGLVDVLYLHFGKLVYEFKDNGNDEDILPVTVKIKTAETNFDPPITYLPNRKFYKGCQGILNRFFEPEEVAKYLKEGYSEDDFKVFEDYEEDWLKLRKISKHRPTPIAHVRKAVSFDDSFNNLLEKDIVNEYAQGKSCVVFTHEKEHCRIIADGLKCRGIPEEHIQLYYGDSRTPKEVMKRRAEEKTVLVTIATYSIATEGTNVKAWERGFLASTVANEKDTIQAIGRCRRTKEGKSDCIIYDYRFPKVVGAKNHGKVRDKVYKENGFTVIGKEKKKTKKTGRGWGAFR